MTFLRTALNAQRKARGESEFSTPDFLKKVAKWRRSLNIPQDMLRRGVNVGFSGGEKKRNEILQMALFEPSLCILDEMDSGLDIDALRVAADGVNALRCQGSRDGCDHALSAAAELHRAGLRSRDVEGTCREKRWQGSGAGVGKIRLRAVRRKSSVSGIIMNVALAKTTTGKALGETFAVARDRLPGSPAVIEARKKAFDAFEHQGLPHRRIEDWKYTDLRAGMREVLPLATAPDQAAFARATGALKSLVVADTRQLVLVDGVFAPQLSNLGKLESGLTIRATRDVLETGSDTVR